MHARRASGRGTTRSRWSRPLWGGRRRRASRAKPATTRPWMVPSAGESRRQVSIARGSLITPPSAHGDAHGQAGRARGARPARRRLSSRTARVGRNHAHGAHRSAAGRARAGTRREDELQDQEPVRHSCGAAQVPEPMHVAEYGSTLRARILASAARIDATSGPVRVCAIGPDEKAVRTDFVVAASRSYFTSNCVVMPCTLCGLPSFASGRKQIMP